MTGHAKIIVLQPGEGKKTDVRAGMTQTLKVAGEQVGGEFALWESEIKGGPGPHIHHADIETFYVLKGSGEFRLGEDVSVLDQGAFLYDVW